MEREGEKSRVSRRRRKKKKKKRKEKERMADNAEVQDAESRSLSAAAV